MVEIEAYDIDWETDGERDEYGWLVKGFLWRCT